MNKKYELGFTLIEMLIVVGIIGILSSIVLVGIGSSRYAGRDARRIADLRQVQNGLELYYSRCGIYPGGTAPDGGGACALGAPGDGGWEALKNVLIGSKIGVSSISNDPSSPSATYTYGVSANNQGYVLMAKLEGGTNNAALKDDVDGVDVYGVNCEDPNYCIQF